MHHTVAKHLPFRIYNKKNPEVLETSRLYMKNYVAILLGYIVAEDDFAIDSIGQDRLGGGNGHLAFFRT